MALESNLEVNQMLQQPIKQLSYLGRQALFDLDFIPPKAVLKRNIIEPLSKVLYDALEENYGMCAMLYGLEGMGKHLFSVKTLKHLKKNIAQTHDYLNDFQVITIDCSINDQMDSLYQFAQILLQQNNIPFSIPILRTLATDQICNLIDYCMKTQTKPLILIIRNVHDLYLPIYQKFIDLNRTYHKLSIIMTVNTGFQTQALKEYGDLDLKLRMGFYDLKELYQIFSDRCTMAFPRTLSPSVVDFCFNFVTEFGFKTPDTYISYLRDTYNVLSKTGSNLDILRIESQHLVEGYHLELAALCDYLLESDLIVLLFLENLTQYFSETDNAFIPYKELYQLYEISASAIEYPTKKHEFDQILRNLIDIALIVPSSRHCGDKYYLSETPPEVPYFIPMPIEELKSLMAQSF